MTLRVTRRHEMSGKHGRKTLKPGEKAGRNLTLQEGSTKRTGNEEKEGRRKHGASHGSMQSRGSRSTLSVFRIPPVPAADSVQFRVRECPDESVP